MTRQEGQLRTFESVEFVVQPLHFERSSLNADSYLATVEGRDVETGVKGGLQEDDDLSRRVYEAHHTVTSRIATAYDLAGIEVDADDST